MKKVNISNKPFQIAVFGSGSPDKKSYKLAYEVGKEIASNGHVLVNGGLTGIMEASAKGARSKNGIVVGILPGSQFKEGNGFSTIEILTGMQFARNQITSLSCNGAIVIGGSSGAYEEARRVWEGRGPVVVLDNTGSKTGAAQTSIKREKELGVAFPEQNKQAYHIFVATKPKEAVTKVVSQIRNGYPKK